jgi:hypothetical protein
VEKCLRELVPFDPLVDILDSTEPDLPCFLPVVHVIFQLKGDEDADKPARKRYSVVLPVDTAFFPFHKVGEACFKNTNILVD